MVVNKEQLDKIASTSLYATKANKMTIEYSYSIFERFFIPGNLLELGPAEGIMTELISGNGLIDEITVIDGSQRFCEQLCKKLPNINVINCLFENYHLYVLSLMFLTSNHTYNQWFSLLI